MYQQRFQRNPDGRVLGDSYSGQKSEAERIVAHDLQMEWQSRVSQDGTQRGNPFARVGVVRLVANASRSQ